MEKYTVERFKEMSWDMNINIFNKYETVNLIGVYLRVKFKLIHVNFKLNHINTFSDYI